MGAIATERASGATNIQYVLHFRKWVLFGLAFYVDESRFRTKVKQGRCCNLASQCVGSTSVDVQGAAHSNPLHLVVRNA